VEAAENRPRGRPALLTGELAGAIAVQIAAGLGPGEAARACGVGERTLRTWRRRAWSSRPGDAAYVDLEKRILRALRKGSPTEAAAIDWEEAAAFLEHERPERWAALPELDDVLGELED
jgi:transposase-like protein